MPLSRFNEFFAESEKKMSTKLLSSGIIKIMLQCRKFSHDETMDDVESRFTSLFAITAVVCREKILNAEFYLVKKSIWKI
jgi:hypothetical protein